MLTEGQRIAIVGAGTIGVSFTALHLIKNPTCTVAIYDTRPDLEEYVTQALPGHLLGVDHDSCLKRLSFASELAIAVHDASIVQEQGPENLPFKAAVWAEIEKHAPRDALFWSSTSGIPASQQQAEMVDKTRLIVVHPFNPAQLMPILELVPTPETADSVVQLTLDYWRSLGRTPVVIKKECTGFVANRLAFALFREACSLVQQGVVGVEDLDAIVTSSMGPRWTVAGPFKSYHAGGGEGGLRSFMLKIGDTVQDCWEASEADIAKGGIKVGGSWQEPICKQTDEAYGVVSTAERDAATRKVLEAVGRG